MKLTIPWKKEKPTQKAKAKRVKVTARDIEENCVRIKMAMDRTKVGTPEYEKLQKELDAEKTILKKHKDSYFWVRPEQIMIIGGTAIVMFFAVALNREWPSAVKIATGILKVFPFKGI